MANELLKFEGGILGVALNLDEDEIGASSWVTSSPWKKASRSDVPVRSSRFPIGDKFLGRVIDPLGAPIDGLGDIESEGERVLELQAASVLQRQPVEESLATGIKAIDATRPPSAADSVSSSSATARPARPRSASTCDPQPEGHWDSGDPDKQVRCIYVAIGQKGSTIAGVKTALEEAGAMEYTTIVAARLRFGRLQSGSRRTPVRPSVSTGCTRQARPDRVRRPDQAGRGLPRHFAAAAPPAGP